MAVANSIDIGDELRRAGRLADAEHTYRQRIEKFPQDASALLGLGMTLKDAGRAVPALEACSRAAQMPPYPVEAFIEAGVLSAQLGKPSDAAGWIRKALEVHPGRYEPHFFWGCMLASQNVHDGAVASFKRSLEINSPNLEATKPLIFSLRKLGRHDEARAAASDWDSAFPDDAEAAATLANIAREQNRFQDALVHALEARRRAPTAIEWRLLHARVLVEIGRADEAVGELTQIQRSEPNNVAVWISLGNASKVAGDFESARRALRRASELAPDNVSVFYELSDITTFMAGDPLVARMEHVASNLNTTPTGIPHLLHYALGKMSDDLGNIDRAFFHFKAGNALARRTIRYDEGATLGAFESIRSAFTPEALGRLGGRGAESDTPIFLVGMPRSGSTLLEQILASHPDVMTAGEVTYLPQALSDVLPPSTGVGENLLELVQNKLGEFAGLYLGRLAAHAAGRPRVTDKLLSNAMLVGLIHVALPNAKIIHCVRDPIDTCLSCFMKSFGPRLPFTTDLGTLGRYYRAHAALMSHWRSVLPNHAFLDVRYEDVVGNFEFQARRLVAFCRLKWDDRCLSYYETRRSVNTASMAQVREPIYSRAIGRWRLYEAQLGPLLDALGEPTR